MHPAQQEMNATAAIRMLNNSITSSSASVASSPTVALSCDALAAIASKSDVEKRNMQRNSQLTTPHEASAVSDTTMSSSDRSSSRSDSGSDVLTDDYGAHGLLSSDDDESEDEDETNQQVAQQDSMNNLLVKPMPSRLQVCPVDDLAVEDEKRRRRSQRNAKNMTNAKNAPLNGATRDAESFSSAHSPNMVRTRRSGSSPVLYLLDSSARSTPPLCPSRPSSAQERAHASELLDGATLLPPVSLLRKDSAAIRRQYWSQLGFSLSRTDLEKSTGRKKERRQGLKVRLNDFNLEQDGGAKGFLRFITSWYAPLTAVGADEASLPKNKDQHSSARQLRSSLSRNSTSSSCNVTPKKGVHFNEEAELFYIPIHRDYSKRQRDCMWPTRAEFVAMVERNLDAVYDEMEREYEAQLESEYLENESMAREEARQRTIVSQQRKADDKAQAAAESSRSASPPLSRDTSVVPSVPTLALSQKKVLVPPRARSSHDLRFKYLKHLGIDC